MYNAVVVVVVCLQLINHFSSDHDDKKSQATV